MNANTSWWKDPILQQLFNMTYRRFCADLVMAHEGYFTNTVTTPIIANQAYYTWPDGFERLLKLEIVRSDGRTLPLKRNERHEFYNPAPVTGDDSFTPTYRPTGGGFYLEPYSSTGATETTLLKSFNAVDSSAIALNVDSVLPTIFTGNFKEGTGCYVVEKDGTSGTSFGFVEDFNLDLSSYVDGSLWVYIPTTNVSTTSFILTCTVRLGDISGGNYSNWVFTSGSTLSAGWNQLELDFTNPTSNTGTGWVQSNVQEIGLTFTTGFASVEPGGVLVDSFIAPYPTSATAGSLKIEYYGTPVELVSDDDLLHPDFPGTFEDLLVVSTVVAAMRSEAMLENGPPRALVEQMKELEEQWLRYIDNRIVAKQRIQPAMGYFEDA